jgi:hypothetical protein
MISSLNNNMNNFVRYIFIFDLISGKFLETRIQNRRFRRKNHLITWLIFVSNKVRVTGLLNSNNENVERRRIAERRVKYLEAELGGIKMADDDKNTFDPNDEYPSLDTVFKFFVIAAILIGASIMFYNYANEPATSYSDCWTEKCKDRMMKGVLHRLNTGGV